MIIKCQNCETLFRTKGIAFYDGERKVRCNACGHVWVATPNDLYSEDILNEPIETSPAQEMIPMGAEHADDLQVEILTTENQKGSFGEDHDITPPNDIVMDAQSGNMQPHFFGVAVFLFCGLLTMAVLLGFRKPIVHAIPQMNAFYQLMDMRVMAPGEGLRLSNMMARARTEKTGDKTLEISLRVDNITDKDLFYPSIKATVYGGYGVALKTWEFRPAEVVLSAGKSIPVNLVFEDMPEAARNAEITVIH